jgi:hypothetical protein
MMPCRPRRPRPSRLAALALLLAASLPAPAPARAAAEPPSIDIRRRPPDAAAVAKESARREQVRAALPVWCAAYREAERPLRRALAEADRSLAVWGPWSRNVCYALRLELDGFARRLPAPPDPAVAAVLDHALGLLRDATIACGQGLPTVTQLRLQPGLRELARVNAAAAACEPSVPRRLEPRPGF